MNGSKSSIRGSNVPGQFLDYDWSSLSCFTNYNNKNLQDVITTTDVSTNLGTFIVSIKHAN